MNTKKLNKLKQLGEILSTDLEGLQFETDNIFAGYFYFDYGSESLISTIVEFSRRNDVRFSICFEHQVNKICIYLW